jgi:hypothetical protein
MNGRAEVAIGAAPLSEQLAETAGRVHEDVQKGLARLQPLFRKLSSLSPRDQILIGKVIEDFGQLSSHLNDLRFNLSRSIWLDEEEEETGS